MPGDIDLTKAYQNMLHNQYVPNSYIAPNTGTFTDATDYGFKTSKDEKIDWAKFAMWLRGFLAAIEGQPLTPQNVEKIMEKLAYVDPDKRLSYMQDLASMLNDQYKYTYRSKPYVAPAPMPFHTSPGSSVTYKGEPVEWETLYANFMNSNKSYATTGKTAEAKA